MAAPQEVQGIVTRTENVDELTELTRVTTHFIAICALRIMNDVRPQPSLHNLALFRSISSRKAKKDESI